MDALDILKVCLRRWYVMLPVLMMSLGTGYALASQQQASYAATSTFAFVYQATDADEQELRALNPLINTELLGTALGLSLDAPDTQEQLGDPSASGQPPGVATDDTRFEFSGSGYTYTVSSWGPTPEAVRSTVENVMDAIPAEVQRIQEAAGAPAGSESTIFVMSPTRVETIPPDSGVKVIAGVAAVGVIAGAALSIALDSAMASRARRKQRAQRQDSKTARGDAEERSDAVGERRLDQPSTSEGTRALRRRSGQAALRSQGSLTAEPEVERASERSGTRTGLSLSR